MKQEERKGDVVQVGRGGVEKLKVQGNYPGSNASSSGLKQALATSRDVGSAFPPFLVPTRVDRGRGYREGVGR